MSDDWTPETAEEIAAAAGVTLDERHWHAITLCRELYAREGAIPDSSRLDAPPELLRLLPQLCGLGPV